MLERRSRHERDVDADMTVESAAAPESPTRFPVQIMGCCVTKFAPEVNCVRQVDF